MSHLIIKNIGPIDDVDIRLNKINVFMGPQSSGKSTLTKIISYCRWAEKRYLLDGTFNYEFSEQFMNFHRIDENYLSADSYFKYESEFTIISYDGSTKQQSIKKKQNDLGYQKSKNIYIPAERNFVSVIPNLGKYKETNDNIMSFLYDWYDAKKRYSKKKTLPILNLGVNYYHIDENDADILTIKKDKDISLKNASSGLQSVTPLIMLIDYLSDDFYTEKKALSVDESNKIRMFIEKKFDELTKKNGKDIASDEDEDALMKAMVNRSEDHYTNFIIEEPEQNLFPETQRDLVYFLIQKINHSERNHTLTLTTHSPYILYALNNCMLGYGVKDALDSDIQTELLSHQSWINPDLVGVWEIENGTIKSIKNEKTGTVSKHYFNKIMNDVMDEYYEMLNYAEL